jgi:hypothetical protein
MSPSLFLCGDQKIRSDVEPKARFIVQFSVGEALKI